MTYAYPNVFSVTEREKNNEKRHQKATNKRWIDNEKLSLKRSQCGKEMLSPQ